MQVQHDGSIACCVLVVAELAGSGGERGDYAPGKAAGAVAGDRALKGLGLAAAAAGGMDKASLLGFAVHVGDAGLDEFVVKGRVHCSLLGECGSSQSEDVGKAWRCGSGNDAGLKRYGP